MGRTSLARTAWRGTFPSPAPTAAAPPRDGGQLRALAEAEDALSRLPEAAEAAPRMPTLTAGVLAVRLKVAPQTTDRPAAVARAGRCRFRAFAA